MKNTHHLGSWFWLLAVFASLPLMADETEIYFADKSDEIAPNVLFLIDASGSMSQTVTGTESRMDVLKSSFQSVMDTAPTNLNIGLMHYANHGLGRNYQWSSVKGVNFPITPIDGKIGDTVVDGGAGMTTAYENIYQLAAPQPALTTPVRSFLSSLVNSWQADGYTPIVDSLYEAARYYRGDSVGWGKDLPSLGWAAHPLTYSDSLTCKSYNLADGSKSPPDSIPPVSPNNPKCIKEWGECKGDIVPNTCSEETWFQVDGTPPVTLTACEYLSCADYDTSTVIKYKSPIQYSCQANYLVLMSDGKPEYPYYPGMGEVDGTPYYPPSSERYPSTTGYAADKSSEIKVNPRLEDYMGLADCTDGAAMKDATGADIGYNSGVCGPELTEWLATNDQDGDTTNGDQVVKTFTVGFALNADASDKGEEYLQLLAQKGKGQYFPANNATELAGVFKAILNSISAASSSFSSPTYTVDANNMLAHSDEVYIPMFDRSDKPMWSGNLKKFKRVEEKQADGTFVSKIVDKNGNPAVNSRGELVDKDAKDDSGAAFTYDAQDFWGAPSGNNVAAGGAASQLPAPADRKLYTDVSTPTFPMDLTAPTNALKTENTTLTNAMLVGGTSTTTDASKLFDGNAADLAAMLAKYPTLSAWAANLDLTKLGTPYDGISCAGSYTDCTGKKKVVWSMDGTKCVNIAAVTTCSTSTTSLTQVERDALLSFARGDANPDPLVVTPSKHIGDMLNTKPVVVDYGTAGKRIFAATNEGFLHSIATDTGVEQWAFMPKSLLPNIQKFMANLPSEEHVYGVDGPLTLWENDVNKDGEIAGASEQRILFFGLRRGGKAYYALDITSADAPKILWKKENTTIVDDAAWHELGETWSKPTLAKMRIGSATSSEIRNVVVFGAGYDAFKDEQNVSARPSDEVGSDVMIVDALTGQLHWSLQRYLYNNAATANPIKHSIPGDIRVMDMDRNGTLDRLYFADTGGNVWRVDMDHDLRDTDADMYNYGDAILTHIAELGTDGDYGTDPRKFFYEPDVALIQHNGKY